MINRVSSKFLLKHSSKRWALKQGLNFDKLRIREIILKPKWKRGVLKQDLN